MRDLRQRTGPRVGPEPPVRSRSTSDARVAVVATGSAALVWVVARAAGIQLEVRSGSATTEVNLVSVVVTSLVVVIAGAGLLRILERRGSHGLRIWTIVAFTVWGLSFVGPLSATEPAAGLVLAGLHLLVGGVVIAGLRNSHGPNRDSCAQLRVP